MPFTQENTINLAVESLQTRDAIWGKTCNFCQKHESLSLHELLSSACHLLAVSFITSLKYYLCTALTTQNTTENNCIISHVQNTTALQPILFLTGIHRLFVTKKGQSDFPESKPLSRSTANSTVAVCTYISLSASLLF
jgi:hypothetical protein